LVARQRHQIAGVGDLIAIGGCCDTLLGAVLTLQRAAVAKLLGEVVHASVTAVDEVAIAGGLVGVSGGLVAVGRGLIAVRRCLIGILERLIATSERLIIPGGLSRV
jgi:hypothetical protein